MSVKPYKVWSADRSVRKAVIASTLKELIEKGKKKLSIKDESSIRVVMDSDGTEVDEEDYFGFVAADSVFLLLEDGDSWSRSSAPSALDETDFMVSDGDDSHVVGRSASDLMAVIKQDMTRIITFSNEEMQLLADVDSKQLTSYLKDEKLAESVQFACQRYLDERTEASETIQLLKLYHRAEQHKDEKHTPEEGAAVKRPRTE